MITPSSIRIARKKMADIRKGLMISSPALGCHLLSFIVICGHPHNDSAAK